MKKTALKNKNHRILAYIEIDSRGIHRITDEHHRILGFYDVRTNRLTDKHHRIVAYGYLLSKLIPAGLAEDGSGIIQPQKPLTPAQTRRRAERRAKVSRDMSTENNRHTDRVRDLRDKLAQT